MAERLLREVLRYTQRRIRILEDMKNHNAVQHGNYRDNTSYTQDDIDAVIKIFGNLEPLLRLIQDDMQTFLAGLKALEAQLKNLLRIP